MTREVVVDTNVPIVANNRPRQGERSPSVACRRAAVEFLLKTIERDCVLVDQGGDIQREYHRHLSPSGMPGVGDRFYQAILQSAPRSIRRVDLPKDASGEYHDFPKAASLAKFDPSDRKFAALARREEAPVIVATDSDWVHHEGDLRANGIVTEFLCGKAKGDWYS